MIKVQNITFSNLFYLIRKTMYNCHIIRLIGGKLKKIIPNLVTTCQIRIFHSLIFAKTKFSKYGTDNI
jgi:hypothetical protein